MPTFLEYRIGKVEGNNIVADPGEKGFIVKEEVVSAKRAIVSEVNQTNPNGLSPTSGFTSQLVYKPSYTEVSLKSGAVVIIKRSLVDFKTDMGV
tara:strand:- start:755 stop:1036 length:282 start_codon:yes stop_codon:yes gene_type:complete